MLDIVPSLIVGHIIQNICPSQVVGLRRFWAGFALTDNAVHCCASFVYVHCRFGFRVFIVLGGLSDTQHDATLRKSFITTLVSYCLL